jgi:hypothetical protein
VFFTNNFCCSHAVDFCNPNFQCFQVTKLLIEAVGLYLTGHDPIAAEKQRKFEAKALAQAEAANNGGINSDASRGLGHLLVPTPSHRFTSLSDPALDENSGLMTEEEEKRQL